MTVVAGQTRYAAFYYGWFTSGIGGNGHPTSADAYPPTLGNPYDSSAQEVMAQHAAWALQGHIDTFICSDWGKGHAYNTYENTTALLRFLDGPSNPHAWLKACAMYELEQGDTVDTNPTSAQIAAHFEQLRTDMFSHNSYRKVNGYPAVFVYEPAGNASMFSRWMGARNIYEAAHPGESIYIGMEIWRDGTDDWSTQAALDVPNVTWFKYAAVDHPTTTPYSHTEAAVNGYSFTVSPGFHNPPAAVVRARSTVGFTNGIASGMAWQNAYAAVGLGLDWILITSFNELGEGTNVEPSTGFGPTTAEQSTYLDIMAAAFPYPSTGTFPDFQMSTVSTTTIYHEISDYVREFSGIEANTETKESHAFGDSWHEGAKLGVSKLAPITLGGFYDTSAEPLLRLAAPHNQGSTVWLRSALGVRDVTETKVVVNRFTKVAQVNSLTMYETELLPTGTPSTGAA